MRRPPDNLPAPAALHLSTRGSSLLLVLWAIMLMGFCVTGLVQHLTRGLDESVLAEKDFRARLLLQSARVLATHPGIPHGDPLLRQSVSPVASYEVIHTTEGTRLAVNHLATSYLQRRFAQRLFEQWGLDSRTARSVSDAITDWTDADDKPRTQGAEREFYRGLGRPDYPFNRPLESLDHLLMVHGFSVIEHLRPDWRQWFTLYGDGTIDLTRASGELLTALFDVSPAEVGRFLQSRTGPDGLADTLDDPQWKTFTEVRRVLDVPRENYTAVLPLLTLDHPVKRIECLARAGTLQRRLIINSGPGMSLIKEE